MSNKEQAPSLPEAIEAVKAAIGYLDDMSGLEPDWDGIFGPAARAALPVLWEAADELEDWRQTAKRVLEERTHGDEVHCACVPALRARVEELEARTKTYEKTLGAVRRERDEARAEVLEEKARSQDYLDAVTTTAEQLREARAEVERLREALALIDKAADSMREPGRHLPHQVASAFVGICDVICDVARAALEEKP